MSLRGHNLPRWPEPVELERAVPYRIPGSRRCYQVISQAPVVARIDVSLDAEHWEPIRLNKSPAVTTHEPWTWVRWECIDDPDARLLVAWEPWPGFEGVEPEAMNG